ncbi:MAG TPA: hypothetical protein VNU97_01135 [Rhizomicrobium sp.]|jgi:Ca2+-binding EF-hand superfamily protein|nr:hypothetical protein [Rhizomicrobium sp.]
MSIGGVGGLNQYISSLLNRIAPTPAPATAPAASVAAPAASFDSCSSGAPASSGSSAAASSAPPAQSLSNEILAMLTQLQQITASPSSAAATAAATPAATTAIGAASPLSSPLNQLMSAIDGDGDGEISQSEMETYIQKQGGTKDQADSLFSALNQGNSGNLTQGQLAGDLQNAQSAQAQAPAGRGHGHHHHHMPPSANQVGSDLVSAMDSSGDGSVDQSEFASFVSALGGSATQATSDFSALDPSGTGQVGAAQFSSAISAFESAAQVAAGAATSAASPILNLLNAFSQTAPVAAATNLLA